MDRFRIRTPLGRAVGLGSAKSGFEHWWTTRITAAALVPLTVWFAASLIAHAGNDFDAFVRWLSAPTNAALMVLLLITLFWHTALGLQVVIEDYIHSDARIWVLLAARFACVAFAAAGVISTLRIAIVA